MSIHNSVKYIARSSVAGLALAAFWTAAPAFAQDQALATPAAAPEGLDEIVVTARKVSENLQDVPVAVTAFSGAALAQQNATRVSDIARATPSLTMRESPSNPSAPTISLRGQVQVDILATLDPSVGTYVDGYYWGRAYGLNSDLLDIRSVQVLKGPQGTLFGRNTTGGAILFETNDPNFDGISGSASATYGRFNERSGTGILNLPIVDDKIALRGAFTIAKRDGYTHDTLTGKRYDEKDAWTGRVKMLVRATDDLNIVLSAERYHLDANNTSRRLLYVVPGTPAVTQAGGTSAIAAYIAGISDDASDTAANVAPLTKVNTYSYTGTATLDTFFGAIKFIGGFRRVKTDSRLDLDGSPFAIHTTTGSQNLYQYSGETQITGKAFGDALDFAGGATYFHEGGVDRSSSITIPFANPRTTLFNGELDNDAMGVYGQATYHITDKLGLTGGLRYSVEDKGLAIRNTTVNRTTGAVACQIATLVAPACFLQRRDDFSGWSYTAGLDYKVNEDVLVYAKTSKGFRSGGQNLRASGTAAFIPFQPEAAYSHEVGIKSEMFDRRVRLNVAGYYSRVNDIQRSTLQAVAPGITATILGNAGKARIWGLEGELTARPIEGITIGGTGTVTRPKYLEYSDLSGDRRQERFEQIPRYQFSVMASYDHEFDIGKLLLRADYSWQSRMNLQPYNNPADPNNAAIIAATTQPAGGVLSARASLSFADDRYEVALFGRNLANRRDLVGALNVPGLAYISGQLREPRTYGVTGTFRFGN